MSAENKINFIYARSENDVIGNVNQLPWHIPGDLARFKALTEGGVVVMGRKTWESLPRRPLGGRVNIVLSSAAVKEQYANTFFAASIGRAVELIRSFRKEKPIWIIGGAVVFKEFEGLVEQVYETVVRSDKVVGDAFYRFPHPTTMISRTAVTPCVIDGEEVQVDNLILEVVPK